jgi:hypothetical protein
MKNQNNIELREMEIKELRKYLKNIDTEHLKYIHIHKKNFFLFQKYYVYISTQDGNKFAIPFQSKYKVDIKREVFTIRATLNLKNISKNTPPLP